MTTEILPRSRLQSKVLTGFSWITDTVVSNLNYVDSFGENHPSVVCLSSSLLFASTHWLTILFKKFLGSLDIFEKAILNGCTLHSINLRKMLCFLEDDSFESVSPDKATATACLTYICANRLVDIMAWVEGRTAILEVPYHKKQANVGNMKLKV